MMTCWGCKRIKAVAYTDPLARRFCAECLGVQRKGMTAEEGREFLAVTIPFEVGDRVECRTAGERYEGTGEVDVVSMDPRDGGTIVYPIFHVTYDRPANPDKTHGWHCEGDLLAVS